MPNWSATEQGGTELDENSLRTAASRFGEVNKAEVVLNKACAFVEFKTAEAARKAITASLPTNQGGEGGIKIPGISGTIHFETRKEKDERRPKGPGGSEGGARQNSGGPNGPGSGFSQGGQGGNMAQRGGMGGNRGGRGGNHQGNNDGFVERGGGRGRGGRGRGGAGAGGNMGDRQSQQQQAK